MARLLKERNLTVNVETPILTLIPFLLNRNLEKEAM